MIELNTSRFKMPSRPYQLAGTKRLIKKKNYGLFWKMRLGKCKAVIDAACTLFDGDELDVVVVVCPAQVKDVWLDRELGEIVTHGWDTTRFDFYGKDEEMLPYFLIGVSSLSHGRHFIVTSYEFLRQEDAFGKYPKVDALRDALKGLRVWVVADEGCAVGNHKAAQTKALEQLRADQDRFTLLDGTPIGNSPMEQYSKFHLIDPKILGYQNYFHFRARHAQMGGFRVKGRPTKMVAFLKQNEINEKVKDHCEYLDDTGLKLPEVVPSFITANLTPKTWKVYCQLRDELMAELERGTLLLNHATTKVLRLAQVCAGFLGGFEDALGEKECVELSSESTDALLSWLALRLEERPDFKCVIWCRWRAEITRLNLRIESKFPTVRVGMTYGDKHDENFLHPKHEFKGAGIMIAQPQAAQFGVNYAKADTRVFLSSDYNRVSRAQAQERVQAINAGRESTYHLDVIVKGPAGQRTVSQDIYKVLKDKEDVSRRTTEAWKKALSD